MKYFKYIIGIISFSLILIYFNSSAANINNPDLLQIIKPVVSCDSLKNKDLSDVAGPGSKVTSTKLVSNNGVTYCIVSGNLAPTIGFNVSMPTETWSQRFMQVGCGGLCGMISMSAGVSHDCTLLHQGGYATSATDMGHKGMSGVFAKDPQKRIDFAYRSVHLTAVATKEIIAAFYGIQPKFSYFNGCSDGGREALMEAQRYPNDFNGIIAGAPAANFQVQNNIYHAWMAQANTDKQGKTILLASRLPILHKAVLEACDGLDGIKDGLISDPRLCHFNVKTIQCKVGAKDTYDCLTPEEVGVVEKFYNGPIDAVTHEKLEVSGPAYGSELNWAGVTVPYNRQQTIFSKIVSLDTIRFVSFLKNPGDNFPFEKYEINLNTLKKLSQLHPLYDATNPDLSAFKSAGGKLILWHGWADQHISPMNTIEYFNAVRRYFGEKETAQFVKLYMLPGVAHCGGGEGLSGINLIDPISEWVEHGKSPDAIMTYQNVKDNIVEFGQPNSGDNNKLPPKTKEEIALAPLLNPEHIDRSRPVYPYPYIAKYTGKGDINNGNNYVKGDPIYVDNISLTHWAGESFFTPYSFIN